MERIYSVAVWIKPEPGSIESRWAAVRRWDTSAAATTPGAPPAHARADLAALGDAVAVIGDADARLLHASDVALARAGRVEVGAGAWRARADERVAPRVLGALAAEIFAAGAPRLADLGREEDGGLGRAARNGARGRAAAGERRERETGEEAGGHDSSRSVHRVTGARREPEAARG